MAYLISAAPQLGPTLRGLRKARKMTQHAVARAGGLRQKTVSMLETQPQRCSVESLMRYLAAIQADITLGQRKEIAYAGNTGQW